MRRRLLLFGLLLGLAACSLLLPHGIPVLEAQSFPFTVHAEIAPNPAGDAVTAYNFAWNGGTPVVLTNLTPDPTCGGCLKSPTFAVQAAGVVTVSVTATNQWGTGPATVISVTVQAPKAPTGGSIKGGS